MIFYILPILGFLTYAVSFIYGGVTGSTSKVWVYTTILGDTVGCFSLLALGYMARHHLN